MADTGKTIGLIKALASVDPSAIQSSVDDWLDDHPEATTTVEDGAITKAKLDSSLQQTVDDVGDLKSQISNFMEDVATPACGTKEFTDADSYTQYGAFNVKWLIDAAEADTTVKKVKIRAYKNNNSAYKFRIVAVEYRSTQVYAKTVSEEITLETPTETYKDYEVTLQTPFVIPAGTYAGIAASDGYWFRHENANGTQTVSVRSETYTNITAEYRMMTYLPQANENWSVSFTLYSEQEQPKNFMTEEEATALVESKTSQLIADVNAKTLWENGKIANNSTGNIHANSHFISTTNYISSAVDKIVNNDPTKTAVYVYLYNASGACGGCLNNWALSFTDAAMSETEIDLNKIRWLFRSYPNIKVSVTSIPEADVQLAQTWLKLSFVSYASYTKGDMAYVPVSKTAYVDPEGDDDNDGSAANPVLTINRGLELGAEKIMLAGGTYEQNIDMAKCHTATLSIVAKDPTSAPIIYAPNSLIAETETAVDGYTKVYKAATNHTFPSSTSRIFQDGIADEATEIEDSDRHPLQRGYFYRCGDTKIYKTTAATLSDALAEIEASDKYEWFYDDGYIYFSRPQTVTSTNPLRTGLYDVTVFKNNGSRNVSLGISGVTFKYMALNLNGFAQSKISDCRCLYGCGGGVGYSNALSVTLERVEVAGAYSGGLGDGIHATGDAGYGEAKGTAVTMIDCWSHDNNDDGFSDHVGCESTIIGGLYEYNGKGGVLPTGGGSCTCYNVTARNNAIGFEIAGGDGAVASGRNGQQMECHGCVAESNSQYGFFVAGNQDMTMRLVGCKSISNAIGYYGLINVPTSELIAIDCGSAGDTTATSATLTIINTTALSN